MWLFFKSAEVYWGHHRVCTVYGSLCRQCSTRQFVVTARACPLTSHEGPEANGNNSAPKKGYLK